MLDYENERKIMMGIFNRLFIKLKGTPQGETMQTKKTVESLQTKKTVESFNKIKQYLPKEDDLESAEKWVKERLQSGDFRALAAMSSTCTKGTWHHHHAAVRALREAGAKAVEAMIAELEQDFSTYLIDLILEADDPRAVPVLKKLLSGYSPLSAYGEESKVKEFIAKFDAEIKREIENKAQQKKDKLLEARKEVSHYDEARMLSTLRQLCKVYTTASSSDDTEIQRLEPIATAIGERLNNTGGIAEMRRILNLLENIRGTRTLDMHWNGIGDWRG